MREEGAPRRVSLTVHNGLTDVQKARISGLPDVSLTISGWFPDDPFQLLEVPAGTPVLDEQGRCIGHVVRSGEPADVVITLDPGDEQPAT